MFSWNSILAMAGPAGEGEDAGGGQLMMFGMLGLMIVAIYFMMIRPQRKQQKKEREMRESIRVGDQIVTIGGIVGRVLRITEEELVIETGADRTKLMLKKWAIQSNDTVHDDKGVDDDDDDDI
ncbi:MAG: preprotein translocase subunit YajC [Oscillospiraceae bacterium]|nr:preprotein translocase subunit YajC [Oscillospiraceae bacterium]